MNEEEVMEWNEDVEFGDSAAILDGWDEYPTDIELEDLVRKGDLTCTW